MNCTTHETWLLAWLDGTEPVETLAAESHRQSCSRCAELYGAARHLRKLFEQLVQPVPPPDLTERIVVSVQADHRQRFLLRRVIGFGALAASLLVAGWFALPYYRPVPEPSNLVEVLPKAATPSLEESLHDATAAVVALTRRTTSETVENSRLLAALVPEVPMPEAQILVADSASTAPLRELQESVSEGIEPVASSFRRATDLFLRYLPPGMPPSE